MEKIITLSEVLAMAKQLSVLDKVRLIEQIAPQIEAGLVDKSESPKTRKSLRGLWKSINITEDDITEARQEAWGNFPREDI